MDYLNLHEDRRLPFFVCLFFFVASVERPSSHVQIPLWTLGDLLRVWPVENFQSGIYWTEKDLWRERVGNCLWTSGEGVRNPRWGRFEWHGPRELPVRSDTTDSLYRASFTPRTNRNLLQDSVTMYFTLKKKEREREEGEEIGLDDYIHRD